MFLQFFAHVGIIFNMPVLYHQREMINTELLQWIITMCVQQNVSLMFLRDRWQLMIMCYHGYSTSFQFLA